jgi:tellurite resistance-related uncharacterized protein
MSESGLPDGVHLVRTTPRFTEETVPPALLGAHRVAEGVWGLLQVWSGSVGFRFEDDPAGTADRHVGSGEMQLIPPERPHRIVLEGSAEFDVAFYRADGER